MTKTNGKGAYSFQVSAPGAYVFHEIPPRKDVQMSPNFVTSAPVGA